ncbi:MAG: zinc ribbon domain-containing protein [Desulfosalsimonadaceae bacterium]
MPVYEFYCRDCHTVFGFFSGTINTTTVPACPKCGNPKLTRQISRFAVTGSARENTGDDFPVDEGKMERAMMMLAKEAETIPEDDPREAAKLMRRLTDMTGVGLGRGMEEALQRMENGEDPETVEAEMGDTMMDEEPFILPGKKGKGGAVRTRAPLRDDRLYDL